MPKSSLNVKARKRNLSIIDGNGYFVCLTSLQPFCKHGKLHIIISSIWGLYEADMYQKLLIWFHAFLTGQINHLQRINVSAVTQIKWL